MSPIDSTNCPDDRLAEPTAAVSASIVIGAGLAVAPGARQVLVLAKPNLAFGYWLAVAPSQSHQPRSGRSSQQCFEHNNLLVGEGKEGWLRIGGFREYGLAPDRLGQSIDHWRQVLESPIAILRRFQHQHRRVIGNPAP